MFAKAAAALLAASLAASAASAHPKLASATPAANATVASPAKIELKFTEKLVPAFSSADLVMTSMPGMKAHAPMKVAVKSSVAADGLTLVATPPKPLAAGGYKLNYRVVSADTHKIEGGYTFTVK